MRALACLTIATLSALPALAAGDAIRIPPYVKAAIDDSSRPAGNRAQDARRHTAELVAFSEAKPGAKVLELIPGYGQFTRVFSKVVGPKGHVYALWPNEYASEAAANVRDLRALGTTPGYANVSVLTQPAARFAAPEPLDVVFTSQNYHDYPDKFMGRVDPNVFVRAVYAALKPGGTFIVIDHAARAGSGMRDTESLHRIDEAAVKAQAKAAGFTLAGESAILRNPADDRTLAVFDPKVRGRTDQFVLKFRKPTR